MCHSCTKTDTSYYFSWFAIKINIFLLKIFYETCGSKCCLLLMLDWDEWLYTKGRFTPFFSILKVLFVQYVDRYYTCWLGSRLPTVIINTLSFIMSEKRPFNDYSCMLFVHFTTESKNFVYCYQSGRDCVNECVCAWVRGVIVRTSHFICKWIHSPQTEVPRIRCCAKICWQNI